MNALRQVRTQRFVDLCLDGAGKEAIVLETRFWETPRFISFNILL